MSRFETIENTQEAREEFGYCYGAEEYEITIKDMANLLSGKVLATTIYDEYSIFIKLKEDTY
jgi:hypothetical protein